MRRTSQEPASNAAEGVRSFIAMPLGVNAVQTLTRFYTTASTSTGSAWRFVAPDNLHITLRFLGAVPENRISDILAVCQASASSIPPLHLALQGLGTFPGWHRPSVLWVGLAGNVRLLHALASRIDCALAEIGFPPDGKAFKPHITLARCKNGLAGVVSAADWRNLGNTLQAEWTTNEIVLYKSILHPRGPEYSVLGKARLTGVNAAEGE